MLKYLRRVRVSAQHEVVVISPEGVVSLFAVCLDGVKLYGRYVAKASDEVINVSYAGRRLLGLVFL